MRNVDQVLTNRNILAKLFYANVCTKLNNGNNITGGKVAGNKTLTLR